MDNLMITLIAAVQETTLEKPVNLTTAFVPYQKVEFLRLMHESLVSEG